MGLRNEIYTTLFSSLSIYTLHTYTIYTIFHIYIAGKRERGLHNYSVPIVSWFLL